MIFQDRAAAGRALAKRLAHLRGRDVLVLALPRGGVPVAAEVADALGAELDVLVARKLGVPWHPELGFGAIAGDVHVLDDATVESLGIGEDDIRNVEKAERKEMARREKAYRAHRPVPRISGRTVIVVDDGLATGLTARAALKSLRGRGAAHLVFAAPVGPVDAEELLAGDADEVILDATPDPLRAVGIWYEDFSQTTDEEVMDLLRGRGVPKKAAPPVREEAAAPRREPTAPMGATPQGQEIRIPAGAGWLSATLTVPSGAKGLVVFAHGSGSSRHSPRNRWVAARLHQEGLATLLADLLTLEEEAIDAVTREHRFDIPLLAERLQFAMAHVRKAASTKGLPIGLFGSSTGAAAALIAAARDPDVAAVVSRGGRPDLAGSHLRDVRAPTLLVVGGDDTEVVALNEEARRSLSSAALHLVPRATHLFEEPGALAKVADLAAEWFGKHLVPGRRPPRPKHGAGDRNGAGLRDRAGAVGTPVGQGLDEAALDALVRKMADHRIVMLGEATHGTHEFYAIRAELSMRLVRDHGFHFIAVEGDWPDCFRVNQWTKSDPRIAGSELDVLRGIDRWPTWMWANQEVAALMRRLREHNQGLRGPRDGKKPVGGMQGTRPAGFYGLDVYSLHQSLRIVLAHLRKTDKAALQSALEAVRCFDPYSGGSEYAYSTRLVPDRCRGDVVRLLAETRRTLAQLPNSTTESRLDAEVNALVAQDAERYYATMLEGDAESWNVRDGHMMDVLDRLLEEHGPNSKAIVWAHNTHVGDARATDMAAAGMTNIGQMARERYGAEAFLLGFATYQGTVVAGRAWEAPMERMEVPAAQPNSLEARLHAGGGDRVLWPEDLPDRRVGHRAIGVVYHPERERGNYVSTLARERYDALVFVDRTTAVEPVHVPVDFAKTPETYPSGV